MKMRDFVPIGRLLAAVPNLRWRIQRDYCARRWLFAPCVAVARDSSARRLNSTPAKPPKPSRKSKPPELLTGRAAFQKTFIAARNYAADVKPFRIESTPSTDSNGQDGKSAIWRASFASAMQHGVKPFIWSGSNAPDAPSRGVSPGNEDAYNPSNASTQVFDVAFLKIDSDQAFAEAQKHGGDKILEKDPTTPVIYICDWNHNTNELVWHVIYGASRETAKLTVSDQRHDRRIYSSGEIRLTVVVRNG